MKSHSTRMTAVTLGLLLSLTGSILGAAASNAVPPPAAVPAATISDAFAKKTQDLINAERAKVGARPLVWNQRIADVSQDWANHLGVATADPKFDFGSIHRADAGGSLIPAAATMYREIVAFNFTPEQVVDWWMNSPSHKAAMLDPGLTDDGVGYVVPTSGPYSGWHLVVSNLATYPTTSQPAQAAKSPIAAKAAAYNGTIGAATGPETSGLKSGGSSQCYPVGCILYSPASGAHLIMGAIRDTWANTGFENGALGYPVTDELSYPNGGHAQAYQGGSIYWTSATGAHISVGAIRSAWANTGFENGPLGYPVTDELSYPNGGHAQAYQGGSIYWTSATGAHISVGAIRSAWANAGFEIGPLGYPVTDELSYPNGGHAQAYQGGSIYWTSATGAHISVGGIRSVWASTGFENGPLGYPTSNEYVTGPGGAFAQKYQGGVIYWTPAAWWVTYN